MEIDQKTYEENWDRIFKSRITNQKPYIDDVRSCLCIGPQNGEPVCPCRMKNVIIKNGRYKEVIDLGPVK